MLRKLLAGTATLALMTGAAQAQISGDVVKIGVLTDKSSLYADVAGEGSVVAAQLAVEEFGLRLLASRSRSSRPTIRTRRTFPPTSRASGSIPKASMRSRIW